MLVAIDNQLLTEIIEKKALKTRWSDQHTFSDQLGQPKPDVTIGLPYGPLAQKYPRVCSPDGEYISLVRPLPDMALPVVCIEANGPSGLMSHAIDKSRHHCVCAIKNIVGIKRAAKQGKKTYVGRVLSVSIEISTESFQVRSHWMTVTSDGRDLYWSTMAQMPLIIHNHSAIKKSITNVLSWGRALQEELGQDLAQLESQLGKKDAGSRKRPHSQSAREADREQAVTKAVRPSKKKKRAK